MGLIVRMVSLLKNNTRGCYYKIMLHSKGNYKQGEKTALRLGENNSK